MAKVILIASLSLLAAVSAAGVTLAPAALEGALWGLTAPGDGAAVERHDPGTFSLAEAAPAAPNTAINRIEAVEFSTHRAGFDATPHLEVQAMLRATQGAGAMGVTDWSASRVAVLPSAIEAARPQRVRQSRPRHRKLWPPWRPLTGAQAGLVLKQP
jgi:hypothetical protein